MRFRGHIVTFMTEWLVCYRRADRGGPMARGKSGTRRLPVLVLAGPAAESGDSAPAGILAG